MIKAWAQKQKGFTIVELLVVIVVIGILAAIAIVSYSGVQDRARAAALATGLKTVEKSMQIAGATSGQATWWVDTAYTGVTDPSLSAMIAGALAPSVALKEFLTQVPATPGMTTTWVYDNDADVRLTSTCDLLSTGGLLVIGGVSASIAAAVDKSIDDGNVTCGKVRSTGTTLFYQLTFDQKF